MDLLHMEHNKSMDHPVPHGRLKVFSGSETILTYGSISLTYGSISL